MTMKNKEPIEELYRRLVGGSEKEHRLKRIISTGPDLLGITPRGSPLSIRKEEDMVNKGDKLRVTAEYSSFFGKIGDAVRVTGDEKGVSQVLIQFPDSFVPHLFRGEEVKKVETQKSKKGGEER